MNRRNLILLTVVAGAAIVAYVAYRWYQAKAASAGSTGGLGTNLNSVAPELVGGSSGPSVGPAFNMPIEVTYTMSKNSAEMPENFMNGVNLPGPNPLNGNTKAPAGIMDTSGYMEDENQADNSSTYNGSFDKPDRDVITPRRRRRRREEREENNA